MGKYWPWEPTATLRSALRMHGRLGGARRFGAHGSRRGAAAYCGGLPPTDRETEYIKYIKTEIHRIHT